MEAACSTGLTRLQAMRYVVLSRAVRNVLANLLYSPTPIVVAALIYFLLLWPLVRLPNRLENRALAAR